MEASALQAPAGLARSRLSIGYPLLRLRSDEQLVALFREGNEEAFRVIHDRYHQRLFAYARQMLPGSRQDAEDALQDIFVRAYSGLRASHRELALRAWLYRVAHNRCIDEMRRPTPPSGEIMEIIRPPSHDPIAVAERRESLRRLIDDVRRLPDQQRSALLMRELGGMPYADLAVALGVSVPAVKSLLVRARIGLAHAMEARDTACHEIREELVGAHDRGVRPSGIARRHMHDCPGCKEFRGQIRGTSRGLAAVLPLGPLAALGKVLGFGSGAAGGGAAGSGAAGGSAAAAGGVAGTTGAVATIGAVASGTATHVATLLAAAAVVTAGSAVEVQHSTSPAHNGTHHAAYQSAAGAPAPAPGASAGTVAGSSASSAQSTMAPTAAGAKPTRPGVSSAAGDATGGPLIPAADQLNPADANAAAGAGATGTGNGTTGSVTGAPGSDPTAAGNGATGAGTASGGLTGTGTGTSGDGTTGTTGSGDGTPGGGTAPTGSGTGTPPTFGTNAGDGTSPGGGAQSTGSAGTAPASDSGTSPSLARAASSSRQHGA